MPATVDKYTRAIAICRALHRLGRHAAVVDHFTEPDDAGQTGASPTAIWAAADLEGLGATILQPIPEWGELPEPTGELGRELDLGGWASAWAGHIGKAITTATTPGHHIRDGRNWWQRCDDDERSTIIQALRLGTRAARPGPDADTAERAWLALMAHATPPHRVVETTAPDEPADCTHTDPHEDCLGTICGDYLIPTPPRPILDARRWWQTLTDDQRDRTRRHLRDTGRITMLGCELVSQHQAANHLEDAWIATVEPPAELGVLPEPADQIGVSGPLTFGHDPPPAPEGTRAVVVYMDHRTADAIETAARISPSVLRVHAATETDHTTTRRLERAHLALKRNGHRLRTQRWLIRQIRAAAGLKPGDGGSLLAMVRSLRTAADELLRHQLSPRQAIAARAAKLKCDGDHAMPPCPDPECWHREEPAERVAEAAGRRTIADDDAARLYGSSIEQTTQPKPRPRCTAPLTIRELPAPAVVRAFAPDGDLLAELWHTTPGPPADLTVRLIPGPTILTITAKGFETETHSIDIQPNLGAAIAPMLDRPPQPVDEHPRHFCRAATNPRTKP